MASETASRPAANIPRLTVAQVLADLSSLNITEPAAATNLITAHSPLITASTPRRISRPPLSIPDAPWVSKAKKEAETPGGGSTNLIDSEGIIEEDEDMKRAKSLLTLYDMREQLELRREGPLAGARTPGPANLAGGGGIRGLEMAREEVGAIERRFTERMGLLGPERVHFRNVGDHRRG